MGDNLPPHVNANDPDAPWNEPEPTTCETCGATMHSPADHNDDCPDAAWNDACPDCGNSTTAPRDHEPGCRHYRHPPCAVCNPVGDGDGKQFCENHDMDDLRTRERVVEEQKLEQEEEYERKRRERLQEAGRL